jgi:hypothetical protein
MMAIKSTRVSYDIVGARVVGPRHAALGGDCQDYFLSDTGPDWAVAIVSDGAGSAARALDGARFVAEEVQSAICATIRSRQASASRSPGAASFLLEQAAKWRGSRGAAQDVFALLKEAVVSGIEGARERCLMAADQSERLESFHATVIGGVLFGKLGMLFHIGDGGASAHCTTASGVETIGFSEPENGEYANETFFFTESAWLKHLRFTPITDNAETIWLMTDGAYQLMVPPNSRSVRHVTAQQIDKLVFHGARRDRSAILAEILSSPEAAARNGDDKTLVIMRRHREDRRG